MTLSRVVTVAILAMLVGTSADRAVAAFLLPELPTGASAAADVDATSSSSQPVEQTPLPLSDPTVLAPAALPSPTSSSTGTGLGVTGGPVSGIALPAMVTELECTVLVNYLRRESRFDVTIPYLDGVFRPPRGC